MANPILLVLAEPAADVAQLEQTIGRSGWDLRFAVQLDELLPQLTTRRPTALLLDERLLAPDAASALAAIHTALGPPAVPLILLASSVPAHPRSPLVTGVISLPLDVQQFPRQFAQIVAEDRYLAQFANLANLGGEEFVVEMIDLFLEQAPQKLQEARAALLGGDLRSINRAAHSLKSSAATLGAEQLRLHAAQLEKLAADQAAAEVPRLLDELEQAYGPARSRLERRRDGQG